MESDISVVYISVLAQRQKGLRTSVQPHTASRVRFSSSADVGKFRVSGGRDGLSGTRAGITSAEINARIKAAADVPVPFMFLPSSVSHSSAARKPEKVLTNSC